MYIKCTGSVLNIVLKNVQVSKIFFKDMINAHIYCKYKLLILLSPTTYKKKNEKISSKKFNISYF